SLSSSYIPISSPLLSFFLNDPATTEIYTLSLHDALPISVIAIALCINRQNDGLRAKLARKLGDQFRARDGGRVDRDLVCAGPHQDRKSTRLNSSHVSISYAVFCLKKKKKKKYNKYSRQIR